MGKAILLDGDCLSWLWDWSPDDRTQNVYSSGDSSVYLLTLIISPAITLKADR